MQDTLGTFEMAASLGQEALGAYVISMATSPSDVLAVKLMQVSFCFVLFCFCFCFCFCFYFWFALLYLEDGGRAARARGKEAWGNFRK